MVKCMCDNFANLLTMLDCTDLEETCRGIEGECFRQETGRGEISKARDEVAGDRARGGQHICPVRGCEKIFASHNNLKTHLRTHTGDRPYVCNFEAGGFQCDKTFITSYALKTHMRTHTDERPYVCTYIQADSSSRVALLDGEGQITVGGAVCGKAFRTCGDLRKHLRTHTGVRPFTCDYPGCEMMFTTSNILKVHKRTHNGERPYQCTAPGCTKSFASSTNYKNHQRIHSGDKPYICSFKGCGKGFTEYSSLYKHHVVHTRERPYPCSLCGKLYRQTSTLAMHRRMAHNVSDHSFTYSSSPTAADTVPAVPSSCSRLQQKGVEDIGEGSQVVGVGEGDQSYIGVLVTTSDDNTLGSHSQVVLQISDCAGLMYDEVDNQLVIDTDIFQQQHELHLQPKEAMVEPTVNINLQPASSISNLTEVNSLQKLRIVTDSKGKILNLS